MTLTERPDVVIMDLHLPDGTGLEAAESILAEAPETRIVMLTGNPSQEALREAAQGTLSPVYREALAVDPGWDTPSTRKADDAAALAAPAG